MTKEQLEVILGVLTGVEAAVVHLCRTLESRGVLPDLAPSFLATAETIPPGVRNHEQIAMVLRHIAAGIQNAQTTAGLGDEVKKLLN